MTQAEEFVAAFEQYNDRHPDDLVPEDAEEVESQKVTHQARWHNRCTVVWRLFDGSYVKFWYNDPATEMQSCERKTEARIVVPVEVMDIQYVTPDKVPPGPNLDDFYVVDNHGYFGLNYCPNEDDEYGDHVCAVEAGDCLSDLIAEARKYCAARDI